MKKMRILYGTVAWLLAISQSLAPVSFAEPCIQNRTDNLAPHSVFGQPVAETHVSSSPENFISKKDFLAVAFSLYRSLVVDGASAEEAAARIFTYAERSDSFKRQLMMFDLGNMRIDGAGTLAVPFMQGMEVRVYGSADIQRRSFAGTGEELLERGSGELYSVDVVQTSGKHINAGHVLDRPDVWRDMSARLYTEHSANNYRKLSRHEREKLNREKVCHEVIEKYIFPKLRACRAAAASGGKGSFLTVGITGSAASGKTTIAENLAKDLSAEFTNVNVIFFDDWLKQASDRPIDEATGKTSEDVFQKFDVESFVRSVKAFMKGEDLLKPVYDQTVKGTLKLSVDKKGDPVVLFGPKRSLRIELSPEGPVLAVLDEKNDVLQRARTVKISNVPFRVRQGANPGDYILTVKGTDIGIGAPDNDGRRVAGILDAQGRYARDMTDPFTGEVIVKAGSVISPETEPWVIKERIAHEDGVYIVEGILSLYDYPGIPEGESLGEQYTTSLFVDASFEVRLERGLQRERMRAEVVSGKPMSREGIDAYTGVFTKRKEMLEDPFIYSTRDYAEFAGTTETRAESVFSLYRKGLLLSSASAPIVSRIAAEPEQLIAELDRIERDFILDALARSTVGGEIAYERKLSGIYYDVYFLKNRMVLKVPRSGIKIDDIESLRERAGDVIVPSSTFDLAGLGLKIDGMTLGKVLLQNEVSTFDAALKKASAEDAERLIDRFFDLQEKMWMSGVVDKTPDLGRYGLMVTGEGRPEALLYAIDNIGTSPEDLDPKLLRSMEQSVDPAVRGYYAARLREFLSFVSQSNFATAGYRKMLPKIYDPQLSSLQLGYISCLLLEYKTTQLWRMFKQIYLPESACREVVWTRLWLDTIAGHTPGARDAVEAFYSELLKDPESARDRKPYELRDRIFRMAPPLSYQDKVQVNKYLLYLCKIALKAVPIGDESSSARSTLRLRNEFYEGMDPQDRKDLYELLSSADPDKLSMMINAPDSRIRINYTDKLSEEGRTIYMSLRSPVKVGDRYIRVLRIKGSRPVVKSDGITVNGYTGNGYVSNVMESYSSGSIIIKPGSPKASGTMLYSEALTEYELMERFSGSQCDTDLAIGVGKYRDLRYNNKPVGYVLCGMEGDDCRMGFNAYKTGGVDAGNLVMVNEMTGSRKYLGGSLSEIYGNIGKSLRYFHDSGFSHRYPHIGNIGLKMDAEGKVSVVIRDLNTAVDMSMSSQPERTADRFLDVSRVIYDLMLNREYLDAFDGDEEIESVNYPELAGSFLKGYFQDLFQSDAEFNALFERMGFDFIMRIETLVGKWRTSSYEELSENNPYFGALIKKLREADERVPRPAGNAGAADNVRQSGPVAAVKAGPDMTGFGALAAAMTSIHDANLSLSPDAGKDRIICHIIDSSLIPEGQENYITRINKISRGDGFKEKVIIGNKGEDVIETIAKALTEYPGAIIDAAVVDTDTQASLDRFDILSLVFQPEQGQCNFRQIEGILAALRAVQREDKEAIVKLYGLLTGTPFNGPVPVDMREFIRKIIFKLPPIDVKDPAELRRLNDNLLSLIQSA